MAVRFHETESKLDINVEDFVFDCFAFKLPELLPEASRSDQLRIALILNEHYLNGGDEAATRQALDAAKITVDPETFKKLCTASYNIEGAIVGLGMDMLESDAPRQVLWDV